MYAVIKYEDDEIKDFHDLETVEEYKIKLRMEVQRYANGRSYEIVIRDRSKNVFHFKSSRQD